MTIHQQHAFLQQMQSILRRINSNASILSSRLRGQISRQLTSHIATDAALAIAAIQSQIHDIITPDATNAHAPTANTEPEVDGSAHDREVAALIQTLLDTLTALGKRCGTQGTPALLAAREAVIDLAVGIRPETSAPIASGNGPRTAPVPTSALPAGAEPAAQNSDHEEDIDLEDAAVGGGEFVHEEDLLDAIHAALRLNETRQELTHGLDEISRKVGHCRALFNQIKTTPEAGSGLAAIGQDVTDDIQNRITALTCSLLDDEEALHD